MSRTVAVTPAEIARARLVIKLNDSLERPTPEGIRKIAEAKPVSAQER